MFRRCFGKPGDLDNPCECEHLRSQEITEWAIENFDPGSLWSKRGIREYVLVGEIHSMCTLDCI